MVLTATTGSHYSSMEHLRRFYWGFLSSLGDRPGAPSRGKTPAGHLTPAVQNLDSDAWEELCCQEAQRRFCHSGPHASLNDFKKWLCAASHLADEAGNQSGWFNWSKGVKRQYLTARLAVLQQRVAKRPAFEMSRQLSEKCAEHSFVRGCFVCAGWSHTSLAFWPTHRASVWSCPSKWRRALMATWEGSTFGVQSRQ